MAFDPNLSVVARIGNGFLAIMPKPAGGAWIEEEFASLAASGVHQVVSLMALDEAIDFDLQDEKQVCETHGMRFVSYPITDHGLPSSLEDFARFTYRLYREIEAGTNTVVHCLAGIGRSGIVSGAVLAHAGMDAEAAFDQISRARGLRVPDTEQQRDWLIQHQSAIRTERLSHGVASPAN